MKSWSSVVRRDRLVPYISPNTNGVTAYCLEPHDLWISKAVAGRQKDQEFCQALIERGLVDKEVLRQRLDAVSELNPAVYERVLGWVG